MEHIGRYQVVRKLAAGGMGEVFLAVDRSVAGVERTVVIKRLFANFAAQPAVAAMFEHEARVLASVAHPAVPQIYALERERGSWFIALEHVEGISLAEITRDAQALPFDHAVAIVLQLLGGLAHVHSRCDREGRWLRIVHRDVAPGNVLVTDEGIVKLIDFGIATSLARRSDTGGIAGTPGYVAPEAIAGDAPVGHRADLFAAGVILYEATVGTRLFAGHPLQVMHAVVEGGIAPPSAVNPAYPPLIQDVVMQALARRVEDRFASADEMAANLEAAAQASGHFPSRLRLGAYVRDRWFSGGTSLPTSQYYAPASGREAAVQIIASAPAALGLEGSPLLPVDEPRRR